MALHSAQEADLVEKIRVIHQDSIATMPDHRILEELEERRATADPKDIVDQIVLSEYEAAAVRRGVVTNPKRRRKNPEEEKAYTVYAGWADHAVRPAKWQRYRTWVDPSDPNGPEYALLENWNWFAPNAKFFFITRRDDDVILARLEKDGSGEVTIVNAFQEPTEEALARAFAAGEIKRLIKTPNPREGNPKRATQRRRKNAKGLKIPELDKLGAYYESAQRGADGSIRFFGDWSDVRVHPYGDGTWWWRRFDEFGLADENHDGQTFERAVREATLEPNPKKRLVAGGKVPKGLSKTMAKRKAKAKATAKAKKNPCKRSVNAFLRKNPGCERFYWLREYSEVDDGVSIDSFWSEKDAAIEAGKKALSNLNYSNLYVGVHEMRAAVAGQSELTVVSREPVWWGESNPKRKAKAKKNPCIGLHFHAKDADELMEAAEKSGKRQGNPKKKSKRKATKKKATKSRGKIKWSKSGGEFSSQEFPLGGSWKFQLVAAKAGRGKYRLIGGVRHGQDYLDADYAYWNTDGYPIKKVKADAQKMLDAGVYTRVAKPKKGYGPYKFLPEDFFDEKDSFSESGPVGNPKRKSKARKNPIGLGRHGNIYVPAEATAEQIAEILNEDQRIASDVQADGYATTHGLGRKVHNDMLLAGEVPGWKMWEHQYTFQPIHGWPEERSHYRIAPEPESNPRKKKAKRKSTKKKAAKKKTLGGRAKRAGRKIEKRGKVLAVDAERGAEKAGRKLKKYGATKQGYTVAGAGLGAILLGPLGAVAGAMGGSALHDNPGAMMNPTALNEMLRLRLPEMSDKEVVDVYEQYYTMYTESARPEMDYGEEGVELIRSVIKDTSEEIRRRDLKSNPKKKKGSKLKTKAKKAGRKAKKFAKTKEGYGALGAGAGALLLGPIGAVAGAIGGTKLHGNPGRRKNPTKGQHHALADRKWNMFESSWDSFSISNSPEDLLGAYMAVVQAELHYAHAGIENDEGRGYGPAGAEAEGIRQQISERLGG